MNLDKSLYRNSVFYFILFFVFALWAFWPNYFSRLSTNIPAYIHVHGIAMSTWCIILIAQAILIRFKKFRIHRLLGTLSYLLGPLIIISGFNIAHNALSSSRMPMENYYSQIALMFNSIILFALIYGLAIYYKKKPLTHARFMVATLFPMFTPLTDRLIYHHARAILEFVPRLNGIPRVYFAGFVLVDLLLIILIIWDWQKHQRLNTFPLIMGFVLVYHCSVLWFYKFSFWRTFGDWIMNIPFS